LGRELKTDSGGRNESGALAKKAAHFFIPERPFRISVASGMTIFQKGIAGAIETLQKLPALAPALEQAANIVSVCLAGGGKLLVCGNGGSAADGSDFATEFTCKFATDRRPYPALDLSACGSLLTAIGNDYGFEQVFARQVRAFAAEEDVVVALSTSGNSPNVVATLRTARELKRYFDRFARPRRRPGERIVLRRTDRSKSNHRAHPGGAQIPAARSLRDGRRAPRPAG
jgi:phosphoheptose isomerase